MLQNTSYGNIRKRKNEIEEKQHSKRSGLRISPELKDDLNSQTECTHHVQSGKKTDTFGKKIGNVQDRDKNVKVA